MHFSCAAGDDVTVADVCNHKGRRTVKKKKWLEQCWSAPEGQGKEAWKLDNGVKFDWNHILNQYHSLETKRQIQHERKHNDEKYEMIDIEQYIEQL